MAKHCFYDEWGNRLEKLENYLTDSLVYKGNSFRYNRKWYRILDRELIIDETGAVVEIKALVRETTLRNELNKSKHYPKA
jgi:hypothetical protein